MLRLWFFVILEASIFNGTPFTHSRSEKSILWQSDGIHARESRVSAEEGRPNRTSTPGRKESKKKLRRSTEGNIEECKVGAGHFLVQNLELNKDSISVNHQVQHHFQPTKVERKSSILVQCTKQIYQSQQNHGRMDHANHGKFVGKIIGERLPMILRTEQIITIHGGNLSQ